jgi:hypothetical protein
VSEPDLPNNLKITTAATAITRGMIHLIQDEPVSSRTLVVLPVGLTITGRD